MRGVRVIRINSDGLPNDTIISLEDGQEIKGVRHVDWSIDVGEYARVSIEVYGTAIHVEGKLDCTYLVCPICKEHAEHECGRDD